MADDDFAYLTVRNLPKPLHAALTKLAAANRRSINAEVVMAIERYLNDPSDEPDRTSSRRCGRCGGFTWSRLHERTCAKPAPDRTDLDTTIKRLRAGRPTTKHAKGKR